jgi:hypothetical protein
LTIGGRVKGTIHANRVKLNSTAVVEGDIYHRSLAIEENAQFEGMSRRQENVIGTPSSSQRNAHRHKPSTSTDRATAPRTASIHLRCRPRRSITKSAATLCLTFPILEPALADRQLFALGLTRLKFCQQACLCLSTNLKIFHRNLSRPSIPRPEVGLTRLQVCSAATA